MKLTEIYKGFILSGSFEVGGHFVFIPFKSKPNFSLFLENPFVGCMYSYVCIKVLD